MRKDDTPLVARMFVDTYFGVDAPVPSTLVPYFDDLFLGHPWFDPEIPPLVYAVEGDRAAGFMGILPSRMELDGRPVRAAIGHSILVDRPKENPLVAAKLVRAFFAGKQELTYSEWSSPLAVGLWKPLGGRTIPGYGTDWVRVLRPSGLATYFLGTWAARLARPLTAATDFLVTHAKINPLRLETPTVGTFTDRDVTDDEIAEHLPGLAASYRLQPVTDPASLLWKLGHASEKSFYGKVYKRMVFTKTGRPLGFYIYYGQRHRVGFVMQLTGRPEGMESVVDSLLSHADELGCVALFGKIEPRTSAALLSRRSVLVQRTSTQIHCKNPEIVTAIRCGDAMLTGLAGECWTRIIGQTFV
ncbi:hypothetical protein [uncultured Hyphomicrobium sp.]|uniref:hypothetical protein n=1 Tax=uncultured Hyphomicrobium sp. TaxID=194373 RepID=UPI0025D61D1A|nr:hypothetical protein [uncultured Hyphomicrobium sp.]